MTIAFVCWLCSRSTLKHIADEQRKKRYRVLYDILAALMVALPISVYALLVFTRAPDIIVFWIELAAVLTFSVYWVVQSYELKATNAEERALSAEGKQSPCPRCRVPREPAPDEVRTLECRSGWRSLVAVHCAAAVARGTSTTLPRPRASS